MAGCGTITNNGPAV